jgi:F-type H+-transporting ATPase subunit epsilon
MSDAIFRLEIVTPSAMFSRDITHIRLRDESGFFGIMKGHTDFMTVLVPSLCYFRDSSGREVYLAVDAGFVTVRKGVATVTSREVFEGKDPQKLAELIESTFEKRRKSEATLREMLGNIEKSFMEKMVGVLREFPT